LSDLKTLIPKNVGVLGAIPLAKNKLNHSLLIVDINPRSMISESFRTIRTNLSFVKNDIKTITVTSTVSGEGKTFIVLNLAGIIAMSGKKVLVVDLDMRRPAVHLGFGANNDKGMSNLLAQLCEIKDVVQKTRIDGLEFIAAGPIPPNPSELILSKHFDEIVKQFKNDYDLVVFDNPPVGLVSDGVQLLRKTDVPIYIFRSNFSKRKYIEKLNEIAEINSMYESLSATNKIILTTEKDYVRIFGKLKNLHYISIKTTFITHKNEFDNLIKNYVEQSSGNS
jgi:capsular exopolysaccharide synthesis family protein